MKTKLKSMITLFLVFVVQLIFAQQKTIAGVVSDEMGPVADITVKVKGTSTGTTTDLDGNYSINAKVGDVLVFTHVSYETVEKIVGESNKIDVLVVEAGNTLTTVVVTAFGIKRNPKKLGYAVSKVKSEDIIENSEPDLLRSLSGKVAGVNVNFSSGVAGAANQINIRGVTSLSGSSQPLIIVDGVAYDNNQVTTSSQTTGGGGYESGIGTLDPNNIATITVLKSSAAAALYGSRTSNGVIVITTKSGSKNKTDKINFSSGLFFENIANLPEYQNTYGNGVNFRYVNANGSWGPRFDSLETIPTWPNLLSAFPELGATQPYEAHPDNVKNLFRTGVITENSVNFSHNSGKSNFGLTVSNLDQKGYIPFNTYKRVSISAGGGFTYNSGLEIGAAMSYSSTKQVGGFFGNNQFTGSASSFARTLWMGRAWDTSLPYTHPVTGASVVPNSGWDHPLWSWEHDQIITGTNRTTANLNLGYPFNKNISMKYRIGVNKYNLDRKQIRDIGSRALSGNGGVTTDNYINEDIESTLLLNFDYELTKKISLNVILGNNVFQNTTNRKAIIGNTLISPNIFTIENNLNKRFSSINGTTRKRNIGVFADLNLSYNDYLFLNLTGRNDWSSTLPKKNNSYFYPSISTSLVFTDALNIKGDILNFGKIRLGYALVGKDADAEFLSRTFAVGAAYSGVPVIGNNTYLVDPELTPEFTKEIELGTDLEFLARRIIVDFSWYKKNTTNLISRISTDSSTGYTRFNTNIGEMQNKGVEIGLTITPIRRNDFTWSTFTTFTQNKNEVLRLKEGLDKIQIATNQVAYAIEGQPYGIFYGSRFARDANGNFLINQSNGGIIKNSENGIIGDPNPDFKLGFTNTLRYKAWSLKTQFDWKKGGDIKSLTINSLLGRGVTRDTEDREHTYIIPGFYGDGNGNPILDGNGNQIPNTIQLSMNELYFSSPGSNTFGINTVNEASIYDGTVYRLRELSLEYNFPSKYLKKMPFTRISLVATANNLWYFAPNVPKYTNFDPEVTSLGSSNVQGVEIAAAPTSKRYGIKLNLTF